ncbi:MAG: glycosyl hydrolase family 28 protein [Verrucomicrobia bacterium]|nr:glycosyl hydrolase family 28 protein [Verrucomicrobiota bacterium]
MSAAIDVTRHGVVPDGVTPNTAMLQKLIEACRRAGGGTLAFPPGRYLTGGLVLCSHLRLEIGPGATLVGSPKLEDYHHYNPSPEPFPEGYEGVRALLSAVDCEDIHIGGCGTIDGQGGSFDRYRSVRGGRPRNLFFARCRGLQVEGLHLRNSGFWMQHYLRCSGVRLTDLDVWNHEGCNGDGIDIDGCRDVIVRDCRVDSSDDAICLKTGCGTLTENVLISNCFTRTHCNHFKTGTESYGDFRNIQVDGLVMTPSARRESHEGTEGADWRGACGIALGCVDGGSMENISIRNVTMDQTQVPIIIRLGDRKKPLPGLVIPEAVGTARGILISGIHASGAGMRGGHIIGLPDSPIRDVLVEDSSFEYVGGGDEAMAQREVASQRDAYPSCDAFGDLPAYGFYLRDAARIRFSNVEFRTGLPDVRPALRWQDVCGIQFDAATG